MSKDFKDYTIMREDISAQLISCTEGNLQLLKKYKKLKIATATVSFGIFGGLGFYLTALYLLTLDFYELSFRESLYSSLVLLSLVLLTVVVSLSFYVFSTKKIENYLKQKLIPHVCGYFEDLHWSKTSPYTKEFFYESKVIPWFEPINFEDVFSGSYKNTHFDIISTKPKKRGSDHNFDGMIIVLNMEKEFPSHVVVSDCYSSDGSYAPLYEIGFGNHKFTEKFRVFTDDETETRSFIDQSFRDKLTNIEGPFLDKKITYTFYKNNLVVSIKDCKNCFSYLGHKRLKFYDSNSYLKLYDDIVSIFTLIDQLKLTEYSGGDSDKDQVA